MFFLKNRSCKFPLICGNTVIHEEAFCYHRGTYCEYIFESKQREYLSTKEDDNINDLDQSDYDFNSNESEPVLKIYSTCY